MQRQLRAHLPPRRMSRRDCTLPTQRDTAHDCSWTASRNTLQTRTPHCRYTTLKGCFCMSDARVAVLNTVNVYLHAKLDAAEGTLTAMRYEMQTHWSAFLRRLVSSNTPYPSCVFFTAPGGHHDDRAPQIQPPTSTTVPSYLWREHRDASCRLDDSSAAVLLPY